MGTIAQKLTYLNDTKGLLKNGINSIGGEITSQTTFRQYATELDSIYASLPKVSGTGTNISLSPTKKGRITSQINGDTFQQTYTGKNLFNKTDYSTITTANNGSPTNVSKTSDKISFTSNSNSGFSGIYLTPTNYQNYIDNYDSETTYYISADIKTNVNCDFRFAKESIVTTLTAGTTRLTYNGTLTLNIPFYVKNATANIEISNIMISTSSDTIYEKYVGGTASPNPDYPQEIQSVTGLQNINVCGKNLFDKNNVSFTNGIYDDNGDYQASNSSWYTNNYYSVKSNIQYILSGTISVNGSPTRIYYYDKDKNWISRSASSSTNSITFTTPNNCKYIRIQVNNAISLNTGDVQLEKGSSSTTYEAYSGETYDINLGDIHLYEDDQIIGTPDNWSIKHAMREVVLDGSGSGYSMPSTNRFNIDNVLDAYYKSANAISYNSNLYIGYGQKSTNGEFNTLVQNVDYGFDLSNGTSNTIRIKDTRYSSLDTFKTGLSNNNLHLVYQLAEPTTTPITDTTLINDLNNFYYAMSKNGETNISVDGNLPIILDVSALKYTE